MASGRPSLDNFGLPLIDPADIEFNELIGSGTFGVVRKAKWKGMVVAVKEIVDASQIKSFQTELKQLSRVDHPNIIKLFGPSVQEHVRLVMEYADFGSLADVLYKRPLKKYKAGHAISWALQCACAVAYLHSFKPKPIIHRDLKPANLLLFQSGTVLKICDFGTACDQHTYMTNNKGSVVWMAPEVFETTKYNEKCDVYSWAIILWELLSRRVPYGDVTAKEVGGSVYRVMWAVHSGRRPSLLENCPPPLEQLITSGWSKQAQDRPSMDEVVARMADISRYFPGGHEPIGDEVEENLDFIPAEDDGEDDDTLNSTASQSTTSSTRFMEVPIQFPTILEPTAEQDEPPTPSPQSPEIVEGAAGGAGPRLFQKSKSFSTETETVSSSHSDHESSMDASPIQSHRRGGSDQGGKLQGFTSVGFNSKEHAVRFQPPGYPVRVPGRSTSVSERAPPPHPQGPHRGMSCVDQNNLPLLPAPFPHYCLPPDFRPVPPDNSSTESQQLYDHYCDLANIYVRVQKECATLLTRRKEVENDLVRLEHDSMDKTKLFNNYLDISDENKSLKEYHQKMQQQLSTIRASRPFFTNRQKPGSAAQ